MLGEECIEVNIVWRVGCNEARGRSRAIGLGLGLGLGLGFSVGV